MKYIVTVDHPYYPEVYEFDSREKALNTFKEKIDYMHVEDGKYDLTVSFCTVNNQFEGNSD